MDEKRDVFVLDEGCVANILSFSSPLDVCKSSLVSKMFRSASNVVQAKFLPWNYKESFSESFLNQFSSKKELYVRMFTSHVLLRGENMSMSVNKHTGKKSFMIGAKELSITWLDAPSWVSDPDSRFTEVANVVYWLEMIKCRFDTHQLSPKTEYTAHLVMKIAGSPYDLACLPAMSCVKFVEQKVGTCYRIVYLDNNNGGRRPPPLPRRHYLDLLPRHFVPTHMPNGQRVELHDYRFPSDREDGWMEVEIGEFYNDDGEDGPREISVGETRLLNWNCGLVVEGIELRPKMAPT